MDVRSPWTPEEFDRYYELRWQVLRAPWGSPRGSERDELEESATHAMIVDADGNALAAGRLHLNSPEQAQIRYMAVAEAHRGRGLGRRIVEYLEAAARSAGATSVVLNARDEVLGFYTHLGYEVVGTGPTMFGTVKHSKMRKRL
jgi:N-acetylglutamate synthase-like GNAT family acetyltransferase